MQTLDTIKNHLSMVDIRPSHARIMIMKYLYETKSHPTVLEIYEHLSPSIPTLSKMTVYNTLNLFVEQGLVRQLTIDGYEARYDADLEGKSHMICTKCGSVIDVNIDEYLLSSIIENQDIQVSSIELNLKGVCNECKNKSEEEK